MFSLVSSSVISYFGGGGGDDLDRKRMKMLDELRNSVSSKVWQQFGDYAKSKLDATADLGSLTAVFKDLKVKAAEEQSVEDETQAALKERVRKGCEDTMQISAEARLQLEARSAA